MPGIEQTLYLTSFGYGKSVRHPLRFMDDGDLLPMSFFMYVTSLSILTCILMHIPFLVQTGSIVREQVCTSLIRFDLTTI